MYEELSGRAVLNADVLRGIRRLLDSEELTIDRSWAIPKRRQFTISESSDIWTSGMYERTMVRKLPGLLGEANPLFEVTFEDGTRRVVSRLEIELSRLSSEVGSGHRLRGEQLQTGYGVLRGERQGQRHGKECPICWPSSVEHRGQAPLSDSILLEINRRLLEGTGG